MKRILLSLSFCYALLLSFDMHAQVSGTVYNDFNQNSVQNPTASPAEKGLAGVVVNAYNAANTLVGTATTDATGAYTITPATGNLRIEFIYPIYLFPTYGSLTNNTVRFVTGGATGVNLGLHIPAKFCGTQPEILVSCFEVGDATTGPGRNDPALINFPLNGGAPALNTTPIADYSNPPGHSFQASTSSIGATWGIAYRRTKKELYSSAVMKRHVGFGPGGPGAIYKMKTTNELGGVIDGLPQVLTTLPTSSLEPHQTTGFGGKPYDKDYKLITGQPFLNTHDAVGKVGMGDLELIEDPNNPALDRIFVVNLYDNKVYKINPETGAQELSFDSFKTLPGATQGCQWLILSLLG